MAVKEKISTQEIEESKRIVAEFEQRKASGDELTFGEIYDWTCHQKIVDGDY